MEVGDLSAVDRHRSIQKDPTVSVPHHKRASGRGPRSAEALPKTSVEVPYGVRDGARAAVIQPFLPEQ
jgi:hypothetical protein